MTIFEKFKEYVKANPDKRDAVGDIAKAIGVDVNVLATCLYKKEKAGYLHVVRENAKKYQFKG